MKNFITRALVAKKEIKLFFALFAMLALNVGNAWAETVTLDFMKNNYSLVTSAQDAEKTFSVNGFTFGYKQCYFSSNYLMMAKSKGVMYCTAPMGKNIQSIAVTYSSGTSEKGYLDVFFVDTKKDARSTSGYNVQLAVKKSTTYTADNTNSGKNYFNLSVHNANNVQVIKIAITYEISGSTKPALSSIEISGDLTNKIYEEGDELDLTDLTVLAKYASGDPKDVTNEVVWSYKPNPLTKGTTSVEVTATYEEKTATTTITGLTVNEHVVTPGTYTSNLNNTFFGCATGNNETEQSGKFDDVLVIAGCASSATNKTNYQSEHVRFYTDSYLKFSVPTGYVIKSIVFAEPNSSKQWDGSITANIGTYTNDTRTWTGNAQEVNFSFGAQNRIATATVTYIVDVKYALTITEPTEGGTLVVKDGENTLASGAEIYEGTKLVVTPTPAPGYVLDALTVTDASSNAVTVTDNTFTMPASDVTVSATFKVNEKPDATLTLSKNGVAEIFPGSWKQDDVVTLPSITSDCVKEFVGWSANASCATEPEYKADDEYTLASTTQTLYAVYADVEGGENITIKHTSTTTTNMSGENDAETLFNLDKSQWSLISAKNGAANHIGVNRDGTLRLYYHADGGSTLTITAQKNVASIVLNCHSSYNNAWVKVNGSPVTPVDGIYTINAKTFVIGNANTESKQVYIQSIEVTLSSEYSNYSTTCAAALDAPIFNPEAGTYNEVTNVTISATDGDVYYTLDGTTPTEGSNKYTDPIVLNSNGTTTIKAIAISAESQSTVVSATYTIKLPLTTMDQIFAKATAVGSTATSVQVVMNNWVVTGATITNAYVTDGTKGFIIYRKDGHGFSVGNILSGTVSCKVQLYNGSAQLTELTSTTEGLTVSTGGVVTPEEVNDVTTLGGINTGSVIKINGVHTSDNIVNNVKLYNTLFSFTDLTVGQEYNVTGVYLQYNATKEILPRIETDIEEVVGLPTATISIENITLVERDEHTIDATITPDEAASTVTYSIKSGSEYISLLGKVITAKAVGIATITATIAEVDGVYHGTTKDFTVTVNEYVAPISGIWELVTDASKLQAGMEVIVAQYVEADGTIYTMGAQNTSNRASVESTVSGTTLIPTTGTVVLTLADAGNGTFALQAGNGNFLYAASNTSNHLKETATINDNAKWSISIRERKASVVAQGSYSHNTIRFNKSNTPKIFSCYESGQQDIALYARVPDHIREVPVGYFATICVPNNIVKVVGATLYKVAGKKNGKLYFDEVLVEETVAGMPYVFFTDAATQEFYYGSETTDIAGKNKSLQGTFVKLVDGDLDGDYMLQSNKIIKCAPTGCWIDPYRAYFDGYDLSRLGEPSAQMPDRRRVSLGAEEENETTGTENIVAPEGQTLKLIENGQLIIIRNGEKFNAQGMRL